MASKKAGIVIGVVLFVLIAGTLGVLAIEQSVKAEYEAVNSWRDTPEGMKNAFCHSAGLNFDVCMSNAIVYTDFYGNSKVSMPTAIKGVRLTADSSPQESFVDTQKRGIDKWANNPEWDQEYKCGMINNHYHWAENKLSQLGLEKYQLIKDYQLSGWS